MSSFKDITAQRFGRLVARKVVGKVDNGLLVWECICDCGNITKVVSAGLRNGNTRSCGCLFKESQEVFKKEHFKHGESGIPTYRAWVDMLRRCEDPKNKRYKDYVYQFILPI